jgi:hypothetical protein
MWTHARQSVYNTKVTLFKTALLSPAEEAFISSASTCVPFYLSVISQHIKRSIKSRLYFYCTERLQEDILTNPDLFILLI